MSKLNLYILVLLAILFGSGFSIVPKTDSAKTQTTESVQKKDAGTGVGVADTNKNIQKNTPENTQSGLQIDTAINRTPQVQTVVPIDTVKKIDSTLINNVSESTLTNTRLFIYIILSVLGLALFFYIFVITLFKTFHKKRSTRQSLLLSWNLFFIISIIWIFIIWGLVAGFWTTASFMIVVIFLFIISLIMTIIAIKSN